MPVFHTSSNILFFFILNYATSKSQISFSDVPAYGLFPPSSWSEPTVNSHPGITFAAKTGAIQQSLKNKYIDRFELT
jgi:hypothetical protein